METKTEPIHGSALANGSAVLMARISNREGRPVEPRDIEAVEYTIAEALVSGELIAVEGHTRTPLIASNVLSQSLQTGGLWTVDETGYNFRHEIDVSENPAFPKAGAQYEVRYEITPCDDSKSVVKFLLRII
jgi:hypothetical protein